MRSSIGKAITVAALLAALVGVLSLKSRQQGTSSRPRRETVAPSTQNATKTPATSAARDSKPRDRGVTRPAGQSKNTTPAQAPVSRPPRTARTPVSAVSSPSTRPAPPNAQTRTLPRLLELGADECVPCKMMQPVLAELRQEYAGKLQVDFIDVWQDPSAGEQFGVRTIPTQIFFNASGKELFRHTGYYPKEDILAEFRDLGIDL